MGTERWMRGEARGVLGRTYPHLDMVTPIGRDLFCIIFEFSFYVFPRGGGPLRTVIVISGSCRG